MATHSSSLAWRIPWTEEPGYSPQGCRVSNRFFFSVRFPKDSRGRLLLDLITKSFAYLTGRKITQRLHDEPT